MWRKTAKMTYTVARRVVIAIVGGTVVLVGLALLVLPGPAFVVIPAGIAILSIEFAWARRWLRKVRDTAEGAMKEYRQRRGTQKGGDEALGDTQEVKGTEKENG